MCDSIVVEFIRKQFVEIEKSGRLVHGHLCSTTREAGSPASPCALPRAYKFVVRPTYLFEYVLWSYS